MNPEPLIPVTEQGTGVSSGRTIRSLVSFRGVAGQAIVLQHSLGRIPRGYIIIGKTVAGADISHTADDKAKWSMTSLVVRPDTNSDYGVEVI